MRGHALAGWMSPDVDMPWLPIRAAEDPRVRGVVLEVSTAGGTHLIAKLDFSIEPQRQPAAASGRLVDQLPAKRRLMWWEWRAGDPLSHAAIGQFAVLCPWRHVVRAEERRGREPAAFRPLFVARPGNLVVPFLEDRPVVDNYGRPIDADRAAAIWGDRFAWPAELTLPQPLKPTVRYVPPPAPELEPAEPYDESDGWPHPGLRLGVRVAPVSIEECEARVLRGLRKMATLPRVGNDRGGYCGDIPSYMVNVYRRFADAEREREDRREGRSGDSDAKRGVWLPTIRDNTDWDYALQWWNALDPRRCNIVADRAADPVWSFRQIGDRQGISATRAHELYRSALETMFETAQQLGE